MVSRAEANSDSTCGEARELNVERLGVPLAVPAQEPTDLALIAHAWPKLSQPIRAAIVALVRASLGEHEPTR